MNDLRSPHFAEIMATITGNRLAVWDQLHAAGRAGATGSELAECMGWTVLSVRPRLCELRKAGLAEETGERRNGEHVFRFVGRQHAEDRFNAAKQADAIRAYQPPAEIAAQAEQLSLF